MEQPVFIFIISNSKKHSKAIITSSAAVSEYCDWNAVISHIFVMPFLLFITYYLQDPVIAYEERFVKIQLEMFLHCNKFRNWLIDVT